MIGILDLDMGNLRSVSHAVYSLGFDFEIIKDASGFSGATHLIIPGVGAFAKAMSQVQKLDVNSAIGEFAASGRPVLGICLGMQVLADDGDEGGGSRGLGLVSGRVKRLRNSGSLAIPHVGWNNIELRRGDHPVFRKIKTGVDFYFVHSYEFVCATDTDSYAVTQYGAEFSSIVGRKNVIGFQFHPEKSQANGLKLLENFCNWDGQC